jgi:hypothetical protein
MSRTVISSLLRRVLLATAFLGVSIYLTAGQKPAEKRGKAASAPAFVEMFKAIADGQITVKIIPKDSTQCNMIVENKTKQPLNVKLPEAFAGVPVLAQGAGLPAAGGGNNRRSGGGGSSGNSGNQSMGGGGGMMGGGMGGMGGGMFNVPPEKIRQVKLPIVCLEHGKKDPKPTIPYELRPIDSFTKKPGVKELLQMLGSGQISQRAAQAAAWHLQDGLSWEELANKVGIQHINGAREPYFRPQELQAGMKLAAMAQQLAQKNKEKDKEKEKSISSEPSLSQK